MHINKYLDTLALFILVHSTPMTARSLSFELSQSVELIPILYENNFNFHCRMQHKNIFYSCCSSKLDSGSLCTLDHITACLACKLCLCASLGNTSKLHFQEEVSATGMCAGICLICSCIV